MHMIHVAIFQPEWERENYTNGNIFQKNEAKRSKSAHIIHVNLSVDKSVRPLIFISFG